MIFIDWLFSLGYSFPQITQAAADTLAGVYENLTGKTTAWDDFVAALDGVQILDDDPFQAYASAAKPGGAKAGDGQVLIDPARKTVTLPRGWTVISHT
jgi:hypothetical protein